MVLGTLKEEQGLYGGIDTTVKPDGRDLKDALAEAIQNLPQSFYQNPETSSAEEQTTCTEQGCFLKKELLMENFLHRV